MSGDMLRLLTDMRAEAEVLYLDSDPVMVALESTFARLEAILRAQAVEERMLRAGLQANGVAALGSAYHRLRDASEALSSSGSHVKAAAYASAASIVGEEYRNALAQVGVTP